MSNTMQTTYLPVIYKKVAWNGVHFLLDKSVAYTLYGQELEKKYFLRNDFHWGVFINILADKNFYTGNINNPIKR